MADLTARFSLIDEMSDKMSRMADSGQDMMERWEQAGETASSAIDGVASSASQTASAVDEAAQALDDLNRSANEAETAASDLSNALNDFDNSAQEAAQSTDHWTAAAQNYDKTALEMIYTTEELVEMGLKTADALGDQEEMYALCEEAAGKLNAEMETTVTVQEELSDAIQSADRLMEEFADSGRISAEASEELEKASEAAAQAMQELETAQNNAQAAMDNYDSVIISGTTDLNELEAAAERASQAAEELAAANDKASKATEDLSNATDEAAKNAEESGNQSVEAINAVAETLIAAKIADKVLEIAESAYELVDAFSEAEKVIVNATGATGTALEGLESSMLDAYAGHHADINSTAAAIGEINTRMGITGDTLTDVTGKFLDFSSITGSDVVGSVQNITKVMNKWNVEQTEVESVLDKIAYAAQISGASVDSLSSTLITGASSFQTMGLSLDNTISLLAAFELYGINSTTAITAMRTAVKNFSDDGLNAEDALRSVIEQIANMESTAEATSLAVDTFGSRAGVEMANAIRNGAITVEMLNGTLDEAAGTLNKTAEAGETLGEKWEKSNNKIKTAFTSALQPTLDKMSSGWANVTSGFGDFLNKHPAVTKALVALGVGLGTAAIAVAAVAASTLTAIPAIAAFGTAVHAALGPIGWIAAGATALTAGILLLSSAFSKSENEIEDYNGTMEECANEIARTEAAYNRACELYGENSSAAQELSDKLGTLNAQFEKGGGSIAVYAEKAEKLASSFGEISEAQRKAIDEIDKTQTSGMTAVAMLSALSEQSNHTNSDLDIMASYADYLNDEFNCDIKVNYSTGELTGFDPQTITDTIIQAASDEKIQRAFEYLSGADFQDSYIEAKKNAHDLSIELDQLYRERDYGNSVTSTTTSTTTTSDNAGVSNKKRSAKEINDDIAAVEQALSEYQNTLTQAEAEIQTYGMVIDETGSFTKTYTDTLDEMWRAQLTSTTAFENQTEALSDQTIGIQAAAGEWQNYQAQIEELCIAYDEAYQAALESLQGQFSLFDQASTESEKYMNATVANAQAALESQLAYWTEYGNNIEVLKNTSAEDLGITQENYDALMSYVQSGNEEAAGLAASMVSEIQNGHTETVTELANTLGDVTSKQSEIAATTADWITGFSSQMDEIVQKMNTTITEMDLSPEANAAATNTINTYAAAIRANGGSAVAAAQEIARQVSAALSSANTTINIGVSGSVPGHATGTTNAEDVFVAGENGPELIIGKAGSTVFPASETNRIISALDGMDRSEYNRNSYTTANTSTNDNSTVNNYSRAVENFDQSETTEVINNYTTVENNSSYDDARIIYLLDGFVSIFSSIESKIEKNRSISEPEQEIKVFDAYANGTTDSEDTFIAGEKGPELIVGQAESTVFPTEETDRIIKALAAYGEITPYDFFELEKSFSRQDIGDSINNVDNSTNYGDTYTANNTRSYTTETNHTDTTQNAIQTAYNTNASRAYNNVTDYGDIVRSYEKSVRGGDSNYNTVTAYDTQNSLTTSADSSYGDTIESFVDYGDIIRDFAEETIDNSTANTSNSGYSTDNSRKYEELNNYGDIVRSYDTKTSYGGNHNKYESEAESYNTSSADSYYIADDNRRYNATEEYANTFESHENTAQSVANAYRGNNLYNSSNSVQSLFSSSNAADSDETFINYSNAINKFDEAINNRGGNAYNSTATYTSESTVDNALNTSYGESSYTDTYISEAISRIEDNSRADNSRISNAYITYGDMFRTLENISQYAGDTTSSTYSKGDTLYSTAEQAIQNNAEYSANAISSNNTYTAENTAGSNNYDYEASTSNNTVESATNYGDSINSFEKNYTAADNTSQMLENSVISVVIPLWGIIADMLEKPFSDNLSATEAYNGVDETTVSQIYDTAIPEISVDVPEISDATNDSRIIGADKDRPRTPSPENYKSNGGGAKDETKRIVLEIAGSGSIDITDGVDKDTVLEMLQDNIKPVLIGIIQSEIYEEGDLSYDF